MDVFIKCVNFESKKPFEVKIEGADFACLLFLHERSQISWRQNVQIKRNFTVIVGEIDGE